MTITPAAPRLELRGIRKQYPGVLANDDIDLVVAPGEIHAVLGENGAGKSTLMKIVYGAVQPDAGTLHIDGVPVQPASPQQARALGVGMVFQHFSLFDTLTVAENVWLGLDAALPLARVGERIAAVAGAHGLAVDPQRPVHALSVGERQRVEIVRALLGEPRLLILDEPTSVLTPQAVHGLFDTLRRLADGGCSVLYISHKLDEIRTLCHRCTVLRAGRVTGVVDPRTESNAGLSRRMIGAEPPALRQRPPAVAAAANTATHAAPPAASAPVLLVHGLTLRAAEPFGTGLHGIGFVVAAGEVLGIAGVSGNGQQELLRVLSGEDRRAPAGSVRLAGHDIARAGPRARRSAGLHFVPEERLGRGAVPPMSLADNTLLTRRGGAVGRGGLLAPRAMAALAAQLVARFRVQAAGTGAMARSLSGGNLQKFIVGREIDAQPRLLIVSQPTWGVDVGAAALIHAELLALRDAGAALLVVSEELDELFALSDRLLVMARGRVSPPVDVAAASPELIGDWMSGLWPGADEPAGAAPVPVGDGNGHGHDHGKVRGNDDTEAARAPA